MPPPNNWYHRTRAELLRLLGNKCVVCGNDDVRVLEINHVNNDGNWRKKGPGKGSNGFSGSELRAIIDGKVKVELELLCANCHALRTKGYI